MPTNYRPKYPTCITHKSQCANCGWSHVICPDIGCNCSNCRNRNRWVCCCCSRRSAISGLQLHVIDEKLYNDHRNEVYVVLPIVNDIYIVRPKIDTGAQANVLQYNIYTRLHHPPPITKPLTILISYNNKTIPTRGMTTLTVLYRNNHIPYYFM